MSRWLCPLSYGPRIVLNHFAAGWIPRPGTGNVRSAVRELDDSSCDSRSGATLILTVIEGLIRIKVAFRHGIIMLPSIKVLIGALLLCGLLFAMTGVGIIMPETHTRIGEMPAVGRPMMQRMITDEPVQDEFRSGQ